MNVGLAETRMQKPSRRGMSTNSMPEDKAAQGDSPGTRQRVSSRKTARRVKLDRRIAAQIPRAVTLI
jgi:hypothetical protein